MEVTKHIPTSNLTYFLDNDCPDGSDENNCKEKNQKCKEGFKACATGGICRPETDFCNGNFDCPDKSDEANCPTVTPMTLPKICDQNTEYKCSGTPMQCLPL